MKKVPFFLLLVVLFFHTISCSKTSQNNSTGNTNSSTGNGNNSTGNSNSATVEVDSTVYIVYGGSSVSSVNASTGAIKWTVKPVTSPTAYSLQVKPMQISGGLLYVSFGAQLFALDTASGSTKWTFTSSSGQPLGVPMINGGTLFIGDSGPSGSFYAINALTGSSVWTVSLPTPPNVGNGFIFPVFYNNNLYLTVWSGLLVLNASSGATVFSTPYQGISAQAAPLIYNSNVYVIGGNHKDSSFNTSSGIAYETVTSGNDSLFAVNASTGERAWAYSMAGMGVISYQCNISGSTIYFPATIGTSLYLFAVDGTSGNLVAKVAYWSANSPGALSSLAISGSNVYTTANINSSNPVFSSYNLQSNSLNWVCSVNTSNNYNGYGIWTQPTISNGTIYVEGEGPALVAVDSASGTVKWTNSTVGSEVSPIVVTNKGNVHYSSTYSLNY